ncbi:hypothetical protein C8Q78DRAFT_322252 [Trametes maxima]|nr:hypothetical protein C8Q78DRAFT_322252 [Trametes maxima]
MKKLFERLLPLKLKTRLHPRQCDNPHCRKTFFSKNIIEQYCSSQCLRDHTASLGRGRRAHEDWPSRHGRQTQHSEKKRRKDEHGTPSKSSSRSTRSHPYAPEYPSPLQATSPPPPYHYQGYPVNVPPPFVYHYPPNACAHRTPLPFGGSQYTNVALPPPTVPSVPAHNTTRTSSAPPPRRGPRSLSPYTGPTGRLLDAGNTPAIALARLPDEDMVNSPSPSPRQRRRSIDGRHVPTPPVPTIHSPTPLRPQQPMSIANLLCPTPESPLRATSAEARHWHFGPPRTPVSSCGDVNGVPTHGGLYNADVQPMQFLWGNDGHYYTMDSQAAQSTAAPFVQAPSRAATAAPLEGYTRCACSSRETAIELLWRVLKSSLLVSTIPTHRCGVWFHAMKSLSSTDTSAFPYV